MDAPPCAPLCSADAAFSARPRHPAPAPLTARRISRTTRKGTDHGPVGACNSHPGRPSRDDRRRGDHTGGRRLRGGAARLERHDRSPPGAGRPLLLYRRRGRRAGHRPRALPTRERALRRALDPRLQLLRRRHRDRPAGDERGRGRSRRSDRTRSGRRELGRARRGHPGARAGRHRRARLGHRGRRACARQRQRLARAHPTG